MRRVLAGSAVLAAASAVLAAGAGATNECRGLQVCVPVAGPWVVTAGTNETRYALACPKRYIVAGLDAELTNRDVEVAFRGALGSPVNPGITTSSTAVFLARVLGHGGQEAFRPHIGCIPASGGGSRFPTAYRAFPPGQPLAPTIVQLAVRPGVHRYVERCSAGRTLAGATHAVGFYSQDAPAAAQMRSVSVEQRTGGGGVHVTVRAGALHGVRAIVQVDLDCATAA